MTTENKPLIQQGWLRAVLYILFSLVLVLTSSLILVRFTPAATTTIPEEDISVATILASYLTITLVLVGLALLFTRLIDQRSIISIGFQWKGYGRHAASGFFLGVLLLCIGTLILVLLQFLFLTGVTFDPKELAISLVFFIVVAFTEEIAFRGYILNNLMRSMNKWVALLVSSVIFALFHATNSNVDVLALLNIFVAGYLLGINYVFTRNIWFATCLHFSWNFFQGPIFGYAVSGTQLPSLLQQTVKGPALLTGGEFGFEASLICLLLNIIACVLLTSYYAGYRSRSLPEFKH